MHEVQDIRNYGGLKKYMPITYGTFLVAATAISGIPPLSGFFSKDEILWYSYANLGIVFWLIGVITAILTAFYMFRLYFMTFEGKEKFDSHKTHPHESPKLMTIPLIILAVLSAIGGFIGIPEIFSGEHGNFFHTWLSPVFRTAEIKLMNVASHSHFEEISLMIISVLAAASAIYYARYIYLKKPAVADKTASRLKGIYKLLLNKYYLDEAYEASVINPIVKGSENVLWKIADNKMIDGTINGAAKMIDNISGTIKKIQNGIAQSYALVMILGVLIALLWIIISFS
jgi:NADH-quinone oxidoreductase subunit L